MEDYGENSLIPKEPQKKTRPQQLSTNNVSTYDLKNHNCTGLGGDL